MSMTVFKTSGTQIVDSIDRRLLTFESERDHKGTASKALKWS
ncbi:MAG: hypothetical protein ACJAQ4_002203 [Cryomorphaceae bacterium]|jgi:hypothetical protein